MKILTKLFFISILFFATSCSKEDNNNPNNNLLAGKWKHTETLADIGDGNGKWKPVLKDDPIAYLEFKQNGQLAGNIFSEFSSYQIKDSVNISFIKKDRSVGNYLYQIKNDVLSINLNCIEGCGMRFIKIK